MAGQWNNTTVDNYGVWLREYLALPMAKVLIAERLAQNPTFEIRNGGKTLHCTTNCRMAIPVEEDLVVGESQLEEPNLSMTYAVAGAWEVRGHADLSRLGAVPTFAHRKRAHVSTFDLSSLRSPVSPCPG